MCGHAVVVNGQTLPTGSNLMLGDYSVMVQAPGNDTVTKASEVAVVQTPKMRLTVWAPSALSISDDPSEDQVGTLSPL